MYANLVNFAKCVKEMEILNNGQNQFFWPCKNQHLQQTIVLTKTPGQ